MSKMYHESSRFASEAINAIRTVSSLALENTVLEKYTARVDEMVQKNLRRSMVINIFISLGESLDLAANGLAFWYGGKLLSSGYYDSQTFFVVFMAVVYGGGAIGSIFAFAMSK